MTHARLRVKPRRFAAALAGTAEEIALARKGLDVKRFLLGLVLAAIAMGAAGQAPLQAWLRRLRQPRALDSLTKEELYHRAQKAEISGRSEMTKDQLIDALRGA